MAWSNDTKPLSADQAKQSVSFQLVINLMYRNIQDKNITVVYDGASGDVLLHIARFKDGEKLTVHNSNLQLLDQPDLSNMPKTPLDYRNEVGTGILLEEAQSLARPLTISHLQQELMNWHHLLYHLPYSTLFRLTSIGSYPRNW